MRANSLSHLLVAVGLGQRHVVAQVVEAELVVGAVRDVGCVGDAALGRRHARENHTGLEAEGAVNAAHPLGVALGKVVVGGDHVDAVTRDRVEISRKYRRQSLALTGLHLGDVAEVQGRATHDLHVEVLLIDHAPRRLTGHGESLGQQLVESFPGGIALTELGGLGFELLVCQAFDIGRQRFNMLGDVLEPLDHATFTNTEQLR